MTEELNWLGITKDELTSAIAEKQSVSSSKASIFASDVEKLAPTLRDSFKRYWQDGELRDGGSYEGYTLDDLLCGRKRTPKMTPIGAFLTLDWIVREPEKAVAALKRGYDIVTFPKRKPTA